MLSVAQNFLGEKVINFERITLMSRLNQITPESTTGKARELLDTVKGRLGLVPNMTRAMANAPAVLNGYLQLNGSLGQGALPAKTREQIALAVAQVNGCDYCLAAHTAIGKMTGLTSDQIRDSRHGTSVDPRTDAVIRFARIVVETKGRVSNGDLQAVREAGFNDGDIAEVVAHVALNVFTNYFNQVADTDIDFPMAEPFIGHHDTCGIIPCSDLTR
jgi:uncharacterized peroxidase-related enzyme